MKKLLLVLILACAPSAFAQTNPSYPPMRAVSTLPLTCSTSGPDVFVFKTTTGGSGVGAYRCSAANTWTFIGAGREPVNVVGTVTIDTTGLATSANQTTQITAEQAIKTNTDTMVGTGVKALDVNGAGIQPVADPCDGSAKSVHVVNMSTATTVEIANAVASQYWHICSVNLVTAGANGVLIATDDTDGCGSITAGLNGGTTAATGWNFAANGGIALGNGGGTLMKAATANHYLCILTSQAVQLSGTISYVSAP